MNKVCVLGSINMDIVLKVKAMPKEGETIFSTQMDKIPGGKGANQAVAAQRSGCQVHMIAKTGIDGDGDVLIHELEKDNINIQHILRSEKLPTGTAIIPVDDNGNNSIIVNSGANMDIKKLEIERSEEIIKNSDIIVSQFEVPTEAILESFKIAKKYNKITILNPAPAKEFDDELLKYTDIIIPNETETFTITNCEVKDLESAKKAAKILLDKGVKCVIITLGSKGAAIITEDNSEIVSAYKVNAVDTTAAGDSFIGGFSSKLSPKSLDFSSLKQSVIFGNKVSSIAVQREGAQPSIPYLDEVENIYKEE